MSDELIQKNLQRFGRTIACMSIKKILNKYQKSA
jgi:hypothetical protein